jgi:hypothetical protein
MFQNKMQFSRLVVYFFLAVPAVSSAFVIQSSASPRPATVLFDGDGTGGWGIGSSRVMSPEEFLKGDRRQFDGYQMSNQGDFRRQLVDDQASLRSAELEELLGVAKSAGLEVKDPTTRLNKFTYFDEENEDDIDLSVSWDEDKDDLDLSV